MAEWADQNKAALVADVFDLGLAARTMAVGGQNSIFFIENIESSTAVYGLFPFPGPTSNAKTTWNKPDSTIITVHLYGYYPNARLKENWRNIGRWLQSHGIATVLRTVSKDTPRTRKQIGVSCGFIAGRVITSAMLGFGGFTRHEVSELACSSVLRAAHTDLAAASHVPSGF
jgi:hypothetical protein